MCNVQPVRFITNTLQNGSAGLAMLALAADVSFPPELTEKRVSPGGVWGTFVFRA